MLTQYQRQRRAEHITPADIAAHWPPRRGGEPYIPLGCDQQGRAQEAAHAATEIGADDLSAARGIVYSLVMVFATVAVCFALWIALS